MPDFPYRLGKLPPRPDYRTLSFEKYATDQMPPAPASVDWERNLPSNCGMMGNDTIGDCTCASAGHLIMSWTVTAQQQLKVPTDQDILDAYIAVSGYDPTTGNNDNGAYLLDVLNYWRTNGIGSDKIMAFVALEYKNSLQLKEAVNLFGGCYIGLALPVSAQDQDVWSVPPFGPIGQAAPGSWGGHAVPVVGYDSKYLAVVTWGKVKYMTWTFYETYCDEAYAVLSQDWFNPQSNKNPEGFDVQTLNEDLTEIAGIPSTLVALIKKPRISEKV